MLLHDPMMTLEDNEMMKTEKADKLHEILSTMRIDQHLFDTTVADLRSERSTCVTRCLKTTLTSIPKPCAGPMPAEVIFLTRKLKWHLN